MNGEYFRGEGKDGCTVKEDAGGGGGVVEFVFLSSFLFISFVFFEFGFCGPCQAQIVWKDLATPTHTDNDTQRSKIRSRNLRFGIWNKRGKTNCDATKMRTVVASSAMVEQT